MLVVVTGATDGIGRETACELVRRGADVCVHGRNAQKVKEVVRELEGLAGRPMPAPVTADFASLAEVERMATQLAARPARIDVVLHNAGIYQNEVAKSADGFELTFAVNHLASFALTHHLFAKMNDGAPARIVVVSSMAHQRGSIGDLAALGTTKGFSPYGAYAASKLANVLMTVELARRLPPAITINALHPGVVSTKLLTEGFGMRGGESLAEGAATSVKLALDPSLAGVTGKYFSHEREAPTASVARDADLAKRFYEASAKLARVAPLT